MHNKLLKKISSNLCNLEIKDLFNNTNKSLSIGIKPIDIINQGLINGINDLSYKISNGDAFSADLLSASSAFDLCCHMLIGCKSTITLPKSHKTVVIGTVKGDIHEIGKNISKYLLQSQGVNVIDLGIDVDSDDFLEASSNKYTNLIICSGTLGLSAKELPLIVSKIKDKRSDIKIFAGGNAFNKRIITESKADMYLPTIHDTISSTLDILGFNKRYLQ